jgi:uncharacterized small protein (DUF1192 family)
MPGLPLNNPRWEKFCQAYVLGEAAGNAAGSYRAAGYSGATPRNALRLLNNPAIRARIATLQRDIVAMEECAMTTVTERLARRRESVLDGDKRKRDVRIRLGNKVAALAYLGKHLGLFVERIEENDDESLRHLTVDELKQRAAELQRQYEEQERRRPGTPAGSSEDLAGAAPAPAANEA